MYVASLRELASNCNFKTFEDEMIRDQIIEHSYNPRIKQKLVSKNLLFEGMYTIAQELEEGIKAAAQIDKQPTESHSVHYASSQRRGLGNPMKPKTSMPTNTKNFQFPSSYTGSKELHYGNTMGKFASLVQINKLAL